MAKGDQQGNKLAWNQLPQPDLLSILGSMSLYEKAYYYKFCDGVMPSKKRAVVFLNRRPEKTNKDLLRRLLPIHFLLMWLAGIRSYVGHMQVLQSRPIPGLILSGRRKEWELDERCTLVCKQDYTRAYTDTHTHAHTHAHMQLRRMLKAWWDVWYDTCSSISLKSRGCLWLTLKCERC